MAQWGSNDAASNSVIWAPVQLSKAPTRAIANTLFGNTTANAFVAGVTTGMLGASAAEADANPGVGHAGWLLKTEGQGGRAGRVTYETLVSMGSMAGDADTTLYNVIITINTQPLANAVALDAPVTFRVVASSKPSSTLTYQWQIDSSANGTWTNVTNGGVISGATSANLVYSNNNSVANGALFRVNVANSVALTVTSSPAQFTKS